MKFGIRECVDVVMRAKSTMKIGKRIFYANEPVCYFDSLKTSTLEGSGTTVYAQGGRGNARLTSWDGERAVTFTMEDALISPIGLSILTGAGLIEAGDSGKTVIQHITETITVDSTGVINLSNKPYIGTDNEEKKDYIYVMKLDSNKSDITTEPIIYTYVNNAGDSGKYPITLKNNKGGYSGINESGSVKAVQSGDSVIVDYYTEHSANAMEIQISADEFGGTFYLEGSTLWRDVATGKDLPAEIIIPKCRVQSNFSFTMASSGDPSSFTFTIDAFPDFTRFGDKKVLADIQVLNMSDTGVTEARRPSTSTSDTWNENLKDVDVTNTEESSTKPMINSLSDGLVVNVIDFNNEDKKIELTTTAVTGLVNSLAGVAYNDSKITITPSSVTSVDTVQTLKVKNNEGENTSYYIIFKNKKQSGT